MSPTSSRSSLLFPVAWFLCLGALAGPAFADGDTIWYAGCGFNPGASAQYTVLDGGGLHLMQGISISLDLHLPPAVVVDSIIVCIGGNGVIWETELFEMTAPNNVVARLITYQYLSAESPVCISLDVNDFVPSGMVTLILRAAVDPGGLDIYAVGVKTNQSLVSVGRGPAQEQGALPLLRQNAPNPFTSGTAIQFTLSHPTTVNLEIYDALGRAVRTLAAGVRAAGENHVVWDGRSDSGETLHPGVYYFELSTPSGRETRRAVLLR